MPCRSLPGIPWSGSRTLGRDSWWGVEWTAYIGRRNPAVHGAILNRIVHITEPKTTQTLPEQCEAASRPNRPASVGSASPRAACRREPAEAPAGRFRAARSAGNVHHMSSWSGSFRTAASRHHPLLNGICRPVSPLPAVKSPPVVSFRNLRPMDPRRGHQKRPVQFAATTQAPCWASDISTRKGSQTASQQTSQAGVAWSFSTMLFGAGS